MPKQHLATVVRIDDRRVSFSCCGQVGSPWGTIWNTTSTSQSRYAVLGRPSQVLAGITEHLTNDHDDPQARTVLDAAAFQVALSDDVLDGIRLLDEHLPGFKVTFAN